MPPLSIILAIVSGLGHMGAYLDYNRKVLKGTTGPNGATWAIWSVIAIISASTYISASGDAWKGLLSLTNIVFCIGTFFLALCCGKFQKLGATDWMALLLAGVAILVWELSTAAYANMIVQVAIAIGFMPTWRAVRQNPSCEQPRPWWMWSAAYCVSVTVVFLRWKNQWIDLVFPITGVLLHASVPLVALAQRRRLSALNSEKSGLGVSLET